MNFKYVKYFRLFCVKLLYNSHVISCHIYLTLGVRALRRGLALLAQRSRFLAGVVESCEHILATPRSINDKRDWLGGSLEYLIFNYFTSHVISMRPWSVGKLCARGTFPPCRAHEVNLLYASCSGTNGTNTMRGNWVTQAWCARTSAQTRHERWNCKLHTDLTNLRRNAALI